MRRRGSTGRRKLRLMLFALRGVGPAQRNDAARIGNDLVSSLTAAGPVN
jgi:hypothetical protein